MTQEQHAAPDVPRGRRVLRAAGSAALWALLAAAAVLLWPTNLGGCTSLTVVSGHSMEPTYRTGDLVLARCGTPQVGDVVVYVPEGYGGARIIHRITGGDGDGWVLQGDNNPEVDPFAPTDEDVVGVARVHVPAVGRVGLLMTNPWFWASLVVVGLGLLVWPGRQATADDEPAGEPVAHDEPRGAGPVTGERVAEERR
ncbi:signal peptidase I [Cellulomonas sp. JZ18]|uniref:signal peptidase I n=1 Tax=Cellulomonas sp. JZ18 TaxID=2654191 RepID=UPI0012D3A91A|nr:signal peptidase I [Cellulomonas sp. JZ18]QGQ20329.1 signal peptidase I [Cellulomonas sp. JZ18]